MKSAADLITIFPEIIELVKNNDHQIGERVLCIDEDGGGWCEEYEENFVVYEKDGWIVEVGYECCGVWNEDPGSYWTAPYKELVSAWGRVTKISGSFCNPETEDLIEFTEKDLQELKAILNSELKWIV